MASITPSLSARVNGAGKSEILFRFVGGRDFVVRIKSGLFVAPNRWNVSERRAIVPRLGTDEQKELLQFQKQLDELTNLLIESFTLADKDAVSKQWFTNIVDKYHHPDKYAAVGNHPLTETLPTLIDGRKFSDIRRRNFQVLLRTLRRFELYHNTTLGFDTTTADTLRAIENFIRDEHRICAEPRYETILSAVPDSRKPRPRGQNTISTLMVMLRAVFNQAINEELTQNYPFRNFTIAECVYGTPYYISIGERNRIQRSNLSHHPQDAVQRDIFVFQCMIGCRVGDLLKFRKNNVINGAIEYVPRKTKEGRPIVVRVPLNTTAREILEKYANNGSEKLLPFISEQKYNHYIKRIFRAARLYRWITLINPTTREEEKQRLYNIASSHLARRTFIGNLYKQVKDPNLVSALSGHKEGSKAFARYRDIDEQIKTELVGMLE